MPGYDLVLGDRPAGRDLGAGLGAGADRVAPPLYRRPAGSQPERDPPGPPGGGPRRRGQVRQQRLPPPVRGRAAALERHPGAARVRRHRPRLDRAHRACAGRAWRGARRRRHPQRRGQARDPGGVRQPADAVRRPHVLGRRGHHDPARDRGIHPLRPREVRRPDRERAGRVLLGRRIRPLPVRQLDAGALARPRCRGRGAAPAPPA